MYIYIYIYVYYINWAERLEELWDRTPVVIMYLRRKGRIDASVGARMARDERIAAIHDAFTRDGKVAQPVDVVTRARVVWRPRVLWQAADAWTEMHRIWNEPADKENKWLKIYDLGKKKTKLKKPITRETDNIHHAWYGPVEEKV